jgi:hypothetical protein
MQPQQRAAGQSGQPIALTTPGLRPLRRKTMRFVLTAAALLVAVPLFAQPPATKADLDARAALQLQMARSAKPKAAGKVPCPCTGGECKCADGVCPNCPTSPDAAARAALVAAMRPERVAAPRLIEALSIDEALAFTRANRRPVLVSVGGLNCSALCSKLRPELPSCHTMALLGDSMATPHLRLICADAAGTVWLGSRTWQTLPTEQTVRDAAAELQREVNPPTKLSPEPLTGQFRSYPPFSGVTPAFGQP